MENALEDRMLQKPNTLRTEKQTFQAWVLIKKGNFILLGFCVKQKNVIVFKQGTANLPQ